MMDKEKLQAYEFSCQAKVSDLPDALTYLQNYKFQYSLVIKFFFLHQ